MAMILMIFFFSLACRLTSSWVHGTRCSVKRSNVQFGNKETLGQVTHLLKQKNHGLWMKRNRRQIIGIFTKSLFLASPTRARRAVPLEAPGRARSSPLFWVRPLGTEESLFNMMIMVTILLPACSCSPSPGPTIITLRAVVKTSMVSKMPWTSSRSASPLLWSSLALQSSKT